MNPFKRPAYVAGEWRCQNGCSIIALNVGFKDDGFYCLYCGGDVIYHTSRDQMHSPDTMARRFGIYTREPL